MPSLINPPGKRFCRLHVLRRWHNVVTRGGNSKVTWDCKCDCGARLTVPSGRVLNGHTKSCGCLKKEQSAKNIRAVNTTHGQKHTRLYRTWQNMLERCRRPTHKSFAQYGGRGISVCKQWMRFEPFYKWAMANGYSDTLTIDRENGKKGNSPSNCRWATTKEQATNKKTNRRVLCDGKNLTISEWRGITKIPSFTIIDRLNRGWSKHRALTVDPAIYRKSHNQKEPSRRAA